MTCGKQGHSREQGAGHSETHVFSRLLCQFVMDQRFILLIFRPCHTQKKSLSRLQKTDKQMLTFKHFALWDGVKKSQTARMLMHLAHLHLADWKQKHFFRCLWIVKQAQRIPNEISGCQWTVDKTCRFQIMEANNPSILSSPCESFLWVFRHMKLHIRLLSFCPLGRAWGKGEREI